jgi:hypothetical protein
MPPRPSAKVKSDLALTVRFEPDNDHVIGRLRQEYKASHCAEYLHKIVNSAPALTPDQITELQAILATAGEPDLNATGLLNAGEQ